MKHHYRTSDLCQAPKGNLRIDISRRLEGVSSNPRNSLRVKSSCSMLQCTTGTCTVWIILLSGWSFRLRFKRCDWLLSITWDACQKSNKQVKLATTQNYSKRMILSTSCILLFHDLNSIRSGQPHHSMTYFL